MLRWQDDKNLTHHENKKMTWKWIDSDFQMVLMTLLVPNNVIHCTKK